MNYYSSLKNNVFGFFIALLSVINCSSQQLLNNYHYKTFQHNNLKDFCLDENENMYVCMSFTDTSIVDMDINDSNEYLVTNNIEQYIITKYDSNQELVWSYVVENYFDWTTRFVRMEVKNNYLYILYNLKNNSVDVDFKDQTNTPALTQGGWHIAKYDLEGNFKWVSSVADYPERIYDFDVDNFDNIILSGAVYDAYDKNDIYINKLNPSGLSMWKKYIGEPSFSNERAECIAVDAFGNFFIGGYFQAGNFNAPDTFYVSSDDDNEDLFLAKYDINGELTWFNHFQNTTTCTSCNYGKIEDIEIDPFGNVLFSGRFHGSFNFGVTHTSSGDANAIIAKFDTDGNYIWSKSFGSSFDEDDYARWIRCDEVGDIFVTGRHHSNTVSDTSLVAIGDEDDYLLKLDREGNFIYANSYNTSGFQPSIIRYVKDGKYFIGGESDYTEGMHYGGVILDSTNGFSNGYILSCKDNSHRTLNKFSGYVIADDNSNCTKDTMENGLISVIKVLPEGYYTSSNSDGYFELNVDTGTYEIEQILVGQSSLLANQICPDSSYTITFDTVGVDTSGFNFYNETTKCPLLTVDVFSNRRRRCEQSYTYIYYSNQGFVDTSNVKIYLELPEYVNLISSDYSYTIDSTGLIVFDIGDLKAGESGKIIIVDEVECIEGISGLTQCTKARIEPYKNCMYMSDGSWDNSNVEVTGECVKDSITAIYIVNTGQNMIDSSGYRIYLDNELHTSSKFKLVSNDTLYFQINSQGQTVRVEADQHLDHPDGNSPTVSIENCASDNATISYGQINNNVMDDEMDNVEIHCLEIIDSYDPNDKTVSPEGIGVNNYVKPNTKLDYLIRFQNTGTDTAYNVVVVDTLDSNLDFKSIEWGASSHDYKVSFSGKEKIVVSFMFKDIYLPDSTADELNSQGFIKFKINPIDAISNNTIISNSANIYFDYNSPVKTNDAWVTVFDTIIQSLTSALLLNCDTTLPPQLTLSFLDTSICVNDTIQISAIGPESIFWNGDNLIDFNSTEINISPASSQEYVAKGYSSNSCYEAIDTVAVLVNDLPTVTASSSDSLICLNETITLIGSGAQSYTWGNGVTDGVSFAPTSTEKYTVLGVDSNGCENMDSVLIVVSALPIVNAGNDTSVCVGNSISLTGSGADTYSWDNGVVDGQPFSPTTSETYTVTGTDINGCQDIDSVLVLYHEQLPTVTASSSDSLICLNETITLTGSGAQTYNWNNGVTDGQPYTPTASATYTVIGTDTNGCENSDSVFVEVYDTIPQANFSYMLTGFEIAMLDSSSSDVNSWLWRIESDSVSNTETGQYTFTENGTYDVCLIASNDCFSDTLCKQLEITGVGIEHQIGNGKIKVYPNPVTHQLTFDIENVKVTSLRIIDMSGRVLDYNVNINSHQYSIDVSTFETGMYFYELRNNEKIVGIGEFLKK